VLGDAIGDGQRLLREAKVLPPSASSMASAVPGQALGMAMLVVRCVLGGPDPGEAVVS
jgi:hypothetical protein